MAFLTSTEISLHVNIFHFFPGHQCPESSTCEHSQGGNPEFTWSIVAAGDQREERNEKSHKPDSPHGWEEGKNQGRYPPVAGEFELKPKFSDGIFFSLS